MGTSFSKFFEKVQFQPNSKTKVKTSQMKAGKWHFLLKFLNPCSKIFNFISKTKLILTRCHVSSFYLASGKIWAWRCSFQFSWLVNSFVDSKKFSISWESAIGTGGGCHLASKIEELYSCEYLEHVVWFFIFWSTEHDFLQFHTALTHTPMLSCPRRCIHPLELSNMLFLTHTERGLQNVKRLIFWAMCI